MADTAMRITVDDSQVIALFNRAPEAIRRTIGQLVEGAAIDIQREMRIIAPIAVTGDLRRSIRYTYSAATLSAVIEPAANYAEDVEQGRKAHFVSVAEGTPLRAWAKLKGINPYALQNSIAKKGTKAHPFVQPTFEKMKPKVENDIASGIARLIGSLTS